MDKCLEQMGEVLTVQRRDRLSGNGQELCGEALELAFAQKVVVADDANAVASAGVAARPDGGSDAPHCLVVEGLRVVAEVVALDEFAEGARRHPKLRDDGAALQLLEALAVIEIGMGKPEHRQVWRAAECRKDADELVDDRPGGVAAVLRLGHVPKVELKVNRFCDANGRAVARTDGPEDEALIRWFDCHAPQSLWLLLKKTCPEQDIWGRRADFKARARQTAPGIAWAG